MKKIFSIILAVLLIVLSVPFAAGAVCTGKCGKNISWSFDKSGTLTISGKGKINDSPWRFLGLPVKKVIIKEGVTNVPVCCFYDCDDLSSITLPNSVVSIGFEAFADTKYFNNRSNWKNGVLYIGKHLIKADDKLSGKYSIKPGTVCIADYAFNDCTALKEVTIPSSTVEIGEYSFHSCTSLKKIKLSNGVKKIGEGAFSSCSNLKEVNFPDSISFIGYSSTEGTDLFSNFDQPTYAGNHLIYINDFQEENFTVKSGTICISDEAFNGTLKLKNINIPASVTSIGPRAFYNCENLKSVTVDPDNPCFSSDENGVLYNKDKTVLLHYPQGLGKKYKIPEGVNAIGDYAFYGNSKLTEVEFPQSMRSIGFCAFEQCYGLKKVSLNNGLAEIGICAFSRCTELSDVILPSSLEIIDSDAFVYCDSLTSIVIPEGVTCIGYEAFARCEHLTDITIPDSVELIRECAFLDNGYSNDEKNWHRNALYVGNHLLEIYEAGSKFEIRNGTVNISPYVFSGYEGVITIPESVQQFPDIVFGYDPQFSIKCIEGSAAHKYAKGRKIPFELISTEAEPVSQATDNSQPEPEPPANVDNESKYETPDADSSRVEPETPAKKTALPSLRIIIPVVCAVAVLFAGVISTIIICRKKSKEKDIVLKEEKNETNQK
ncbi:MAG: leucine-rich repeat domain-containing protein [Clostridia bacterium]|nr:leucine-rich repeat domain-containing protein [Clostridia bacterium]